MQSINNTTIQYCLRFYSKLSIVLKIRIFVSATIDIDNHSIFNNFSFCMIDNTDEPDHLFLAIIFSHFV